MGTEHAVQTSTMLLLLRWSLTCVQINLEGEKPLGCPGNTQMLEMSHPFMVNWISKLERSEWSCSVFTWVFRFCVQAWLCTLWGRENLFVCVLLALQAMENLLEEEVPGRDWEIHPPIHSPLHPLTSWLICPLPCNKLIQNLQNYIPCSSLSLFSLRADSRLAIISSFLQV